MSMTHPAAPLAQASLPDADGMDHFSVLVLCTGNSARSQLAEALLAVRSAHRDAGRLRVASAGSRPAARVNPWAVDVLATHGIAWQHRIPKHIDAVADDRWDLVITVCDNARDACPFLPGAGAQVHWGLPDPADAEGDVAATREFLWTYHALLLRVNALLSLPLEAMGAPLLVQAATAIHEAAVVLEHPLGESAAIRR